MQRRTLWTLYGCNLLASVGFWFFLPLLPIFLSRRGGSAALVGAVFASGLLANALIRYPAGWAADRFGTRPVMIVSLASEAVLFLGYLPHLPLAAFIALRFVHGAAAGAFWPAANGLIAEVAPPKELGRAFGVMQSMNMVGIIIGPAIGGFIALANLSVVFVVAAIVSGLAAIPIATVPNVRLARSAEAPVGALRIARRLLPLIIIGVGLIEGAFTISGAPSLIAEVSRNAEPGYQGRTQGVFQAVQSSIQIAGSLAGGYLFTIGPAYAFLAITAFCVMGAASGTWLSSARGRAAAIRTKPLRES